MIGYKYFDFGSDYVGGRMTLSMKIVGADCKAAVRRPLDDDQKGREVGVCQIGAQDGEYHATIEKITGRYALFFAVDNP